MKVLAIERDVPGVSADAFTPAILREEAARAWELYRLGALREAFFTPDHAAVLVLECAGEEEARRLLASLPLVRDGLIAFDVLPLTPYDGFARLFAEPA